jgi:ribose transport system permease protein
VFGTLLGAAFVNVITSGLLQLRIGEFWIQACLGLILLAAVLADRGRHLLLRRRGLV